MIFRLSASIPLKQETLASRRCEIVGRQPPIIFASLSRTWRVGAQILIFDVAFKGSSALILVAATESLCLSIKEEPVGLTIRSKGLFVKAKMKL